MANNSANMQLLKKLLFVLSVGLIFQFCGIRLVLSQEPLLNEMRTAYALLDAASGPVAMSESHIIGSATGQIVPEDYTLVTKVGRHGFVHLMVDRRNNRETARGLNSQYGFDLERNLSSDKWYVAAVVPRDKAGDYEMTLNSSSFSPGFFQVSWKSVVDASSFRILKSVYGKVGTFNTVSVWFEAGPEELSVNGRVSIPKIRQGVAVLLTEHQFVPIQFAFDVTFPKDEPAHIEAEYSYDLAIAQFPLRTRYKRVSEYKGEVHEFTQEVKWSRIGKEPEFGEICLSAFGLQEPSFVRDRKWLWMLIVIIAASVAITFAFCIRRGQSGDVV